MTLQGIPQTKGNRGVREMVIYLTNVEVVVKAAGMTGRLLPATAETATGKVSRAEVEVVAMKVPVAKALERGRIKNRAAEVRSVTARAEGGCLRTARTKQAKMDKSASTAQGTTTSANGRGCTPGPFAVNQTAAIMALGLENQQPNRMPGKRPHLGGSGEGIRCSTQTHGPGQHE